MGRRGPLRRPAGVAVPAGRADAALAPVFAWFGLVPLLWAFSRIAQSGERRPLRRAFFVAYLCGLLWYMGNCYWVRDTMMHYGDMPPLAPTLLLIGYSLVLGLYFGLFGLGVALVRRATGSTRLALAFAPILWTALELAAARITSVPWDQLGYSQVDNALGQPARALDRRLRDQLCAGGGECLPGRRFAAGHAKSEEVALCRPLGLGRLRSACC